jgi:3-hydroxyacyl-CoA dehydrogenase
VFARAGRPTRLYDQDPAQAKRAISWLEEDLERNVRDRAMGVKAAAALRARVSVHRDLHEALAGVEYVQENGPENVTEKRRIYRELDNAAPRDAILASSTSAIDMSAIAGGLTGAWRCIVAHPVNPPHVIPAVEVLPGSETSREIIARTCDFLRDVGQTPVLLRKYAVGFALNRMQAALVREALDLVESGVADVDGVDALIRDGLGLRWALLGPFGVGHSNADGGLREYYTKYGNAYRGLMQGLNQEIPGFDPAMVNRLAIETERMEGPTSRLPRILRWRDRMIRKLRALKTEDPHP